jgi:phosphoglycerate-specific signal transduction histidine kinase
METELNESNKNFLIYSAFYLTYLEKANADYEEKEKVKIKFGELKNTFLTDDVKTKEEMKNAMKDAMGEFIEDAKKILGIEKEEEEEE